MAIRIFMNVKRVSNKTKRLRAYINNPFNKEFMIKVKNKLRENIRDSSNRPLPYHTYPSPHNGNLESSCFVEKQGAELIMGSDADYAGVLEYGRREMRRTKHPFIFEGYYPNPRAIRIALNKAKPAWLNRPMSEFTGTLGKYNSKLTGEKMEKQNIKHITRMFEGNIAEMKWSKTKQFPKGKPLMQGKKGVRSKTMLVIMENALRTMNIPGTPTMTGKKNIKTLSESRVWATLPYGIYTIFAYHTKAIPQYHVFTKTAEWAKEDFIGAVKKTVRKIDMEIAS